MIKKNYNFIKLKYEVPVITKQASKTSKLCNNSFIECKYLNILLFAAISLTLDCTEHVHRVLCTTYTYIHFWPVSSADFFNFIQFCSGCIFYCAYNFLRYIFQSLHYGIFFYLVLALCLSFSSMGFTKALKLLDYSNLHLDVFNHLSISFCGFKGEKLKINFFCKIFNFFTIQIIVHSSFILKIQK